PLTVLEDGPPDQLLALVPGRGAAQIGEERMVVLGRHGRGGWLGSLATGPNATLRWKLSLADEIELRDLVRLSPDGDTLLLVGGRRKQQSTPWSAVMERGDEPAHLVRQDDLTLVGVAAESSLRTIVDLGAAGFAALGSAGSGPGVEHEQLFVAGFDRSGKPTWSRVLDEVRAGAVLGVAAREGHALFLVSVPLIDIDDRGRPVQSVALIDLVPAVESDDEAEGKAAVVVTSRMLEGSESWTTAGFVDHRAEAIALYGQRPAGIVWRLVGVPESAPESAPDNTPEN
ncbi:MAG: hypothetical protein KC457_08455, partial [Myxococcales bacterium]|nr:hypothetical protein [Myxococcales bacterium]